jgi:hypothetical protein
MQHVWDSVLWHLRVCVFRRRPVYALNYVAVAFNDAIKVKLSL